MAKALIDGDIVAYRCAASCEPTKEKLEREPYRLAVLRADELMYRILNDVGTDEFKLYLSGDDNFRYKIDPNYKANRKDKTRPLWLEPIREFLANEWEAVVVSGYEADDAIGIHLTDDHVVCSIDKDLLQLPGRHYNFVKGEFYYITPEQGEFNFWTLMLTGDISDNIPGVAGIGPVKAGRALAGLSPSEMRDRVLSMYDDPERFEKNYKLIRVLRHDPTISESEGSETTTEGT